MQYVSVVNWRRFQHYKDRNPAWIKLYTTTLDNPEYECLPDASKVLLYTLWMLAARHNNAIPADADRLYRKYSLSELPNFQPLIAAGFIELYQNGSVPLANAEQDASLREKRRGEKKEETLAALADRRREQQDKNKPVCLVCRSLATREQETSRGDTIRLCDQCHGYLKAAGGRFSARCDPAHIEKLVLEGKAKGGIV